MNSEIEKECDIKEAAVALIKDDDSEESRQRNPIVVLKCIQVCWYLDRERERR